MKTILQYYLGQSVSGYNSLATDIPYSIEVLDDLTFFTDSVLPTIEALYPLYQEFSRVFVADINVDYFKSTLILASQFIQDYIGLVVIPQKTILRFARFPASRMQWRIPSGKIISNSVSISYRSTEDVLTTFETSKYSIAYDSYRPVLSLNSYNDFWPFVTFMRPFPVTFEASFRTLDITGKTASQIQMMYARILQPLFMIAYHFYQTRSTVRQDAVTEVPYAMLTPLNSLVVR